MAKELTEDEVKLICTAALYDLDGSKEPEGNDELTPQERIDYASQGDGTEVIFNNSRIAGVRCWSYEGIVFAIVDLHAKKVLFTSTDSEFLAPTGTGELVWNVTPGEYRLKYLVTIGFSGDWKIKEGPFDTRELAEEFIRTEVSDTAGVTIDVMEGTERRDTIHVR